MPSRSTNRMVNPTTSRTAIRPVSSTRSSLTGPSISMYWAIHIGRSGLSCWAYQTLRCAADRGMYSEDDICRKHFPVGGVQGGDKERPEEGLNTFPLPPHSAPAPEI